MNDLNSTSSAKDLHILVVANTFPPDEQGGGGRVAGDCALGMRSLGHRVSVLTTRLPGRSLKLFPKPEIWGDCAVYRWYPPNVYPLRQAAGKPRWLKAIWTLWDAVNPISFLIISFWLRRLRPDVIVSHNLKGMGYSLPDLFSRTCPYIHVLHDVQLVEPSGVLYAEKYAGQAAVSRASKLHSQLMRFAFRSVRKQAAPSNFLLEFHLDRGFFQRAQGRRIRNPIVLPTHRKTPERVLFAVGAGVYKGILEVLEVWERLGWSDWTLEVAGGGDAMEVLRQKASLDPRIRILGHLNRSEYFEKMSRAGILIHLSRCLEGWPMAMAEARSLGLPVVATRVGGSVDFESEGSIEWVDPGDLEAAVRSLERFRSEFDAVRARAHFPDAPAYAKALLEWVFEPPPE